MSTAAKLNPSWPLWAIGVSAGVLGAVLSSTVLMLNHVEYVKSSQKEVSKLSSKISLLEVALGQAQPYVMKLDEQQLAQTQEILPIAIQPAQVAPVRVAQAPVAPPARPPAPPAPVQQPAPVAKPAVQAPAVQPATAKAPIAPAPAVQAQVPAVPAQQAATPQPVTADELAAASKNKIEGVSAARAGIFKLHIDAVEFTSGRRVRKGEMFPSGEKLLKVDPNEGRIITNQRQLLIFEQ